MVVVCSTVWKKHPLYVPESSISAYQSALVWRDFVDILPLGSTAIENVVKEKSESEKVYYDLHGRRIETPIKGCLYVRDGKKLIF